MKKTRIAAFHSNGTSPRKRLERIIDEIAGAAKERIRDPKNAAKGNSWRELSWVQLQSLTREEVLEFIRECANGGSEERKMMEAGDVMAFLAMALSNTREGERT